MLEEKKTGSNSYFFVEQTVKGVSEYSLKSVEII